MGYASSIQDIRAELKITQVELARRAGVNVSTVWRWEENGIPERGPARAFLDGLAREAGYDGIASKAGAAA